MQRMAGLLVLSLTAASLVGCAYDPYTGTYVPCCGYYGNPYYGNPYYRYPQPYAPYGYPSGPYVAQPPNQPGTYASPPSQFQPGPYAPPQQGQPGAYASPPEQLQPAPYAPSQQSQPGAYPAPPGQLPAEPDAAASPAGGARYLAAISTTRDGRLTRDQSMADMPLVARGFGSM